MLHKIVEELRAHKNPLIIKNEEGQALIEKPLLKYGEIAPAICNAIRSAKEEVLFIGYKMDSECDGERDFLEALKNLSDQIVNNAEKVRVRIIINRKGGLAGKLIKPKLSTLQKKSQQELTSSYPNLDFQFVEHIHGAFGSYHQKQVIIDNHTAILTSGDFSQANNYKEEYHGWTEVGTILRGREFVDHIRKSFLISWNSLASKPLFAEAKKDIPAYLVKSADIINDPEYIKLPKANVLYLHKKANGNPFKRLHLSPFTIALIKAIENAQDTIAIMTPNLNHPQVLEALVNAYAQKPKLEIRIVTGKEHNASLEDNFLMGGTNQQSYAKLIALMARKGIHDYSRLHLKYMRDEGKQIVREAGKETLHAKLIMIDNLTLIGSSTLDGQSVYYSQEGDVCIESEDVTQQYNKNIFKPVFDNGLNAFSEPLQAQTRQLIKVVEKVLIALDEKKRSVSDNFKRKIIEDTISELSDVKKVLLCYKNCADDLRQDKVDIATNNFFDTINNNLLNNNAFKKENSFLKEIKRIITDGLKRLVSQHRFETSLSTQGFFADVGNYAKKRISAINHQAICEKQCAIP